jgi:hypothetical protein
MIGLLCFVLAVLASPFKSKLRLEAENAVLIAGPTVFMTPSATSGSTGRRIRLKSRRATNTSEIAACDASTFNNATRSGVKIRRSLRSRGGKQRHGVLHFANDGLSVRGIALALEQPQAAVDHGEKVANVVDDELRHVRYRPHPLPPVGGRSARRGAEGDRPSRNQWGLLGLGSSDEGRRQRCHEVTGSFYLMEQSTGLKEPAIMCFPPGARWLRLSPQPSRPLRGFSCRSAFAKLLFVLHLR